MAQMACVIDAHRLSDRYGPSKRRGTRQITSSRIPLNKGVLIVLLSFVLAP